MFRKKILIGKINFCKQKTVYFPILEGLPRKEGWRSRGGPDLKIKVSHHFIKSGPPRPTGTPPDFSSRGENTKIEGAICALYHISKLTITY
jgi:hypothetical protein